MEDNENKSTPKVVSKDNVFVGLVGPLAFPEFNVIPGQESRKITLDDVIKNLCSETIVPEIENFKKSYEHISENIHKLFIVPTEFRILNKLVYPLKSAIRGYVTGNYLSTIALCGMVAEMAIIFHYETLKIKINERDAEDVVKKLFGRKFEKLGQESRIRFLQALGFLDDELVKNFNTIRDCRREYLHFLSKDIANIAPDAKKAFDSALDIVIKILGVRIGEPGKIILNQNIVDYLNSKGLSEKSNSKDNYSDLVDKYENQSG